MRKFLLLFTLITCTVIGVWAQSGRFQPAVAGVHPATSLNLSNQEVVNQKDVSEYQRCFTVENEAQIRAANPSLPTEAEFETWMARKIEERKAAGITERATYSIPYIVHIIHDGEAIGVGDNISDAKVYAQMSQINDDFQRMNSDAGNTPAAFTGVAGSIDIEFVPAIIDNNGDTMTTPGIRRINRNTQGWSAPPYGGNACLTTGFDNSYIEGTIKPASQWDPTKYMNIWALDMTCGILGYAQFPTGSGLPGLPGSATSNTDGLVLLSSSMGSIANPGSGAPFNLGRTATHEIGHWLGLRHIWGDGTCATDYCDDTPTQSGPNESNCPSFPSVSCSNGPNGDMFMNYMDYTTDACMNIFTEDQVSRFEAVLNNSPRRVELLSSTVGGQVPAEDTCDAGDLTVADSVGLCTGTSVTVSNNGTNTIPSGGGYGFLFTPGADGTGALGGEFLLSGTGTSRTIDESLGGLLPGNSFPNFAGTWYVSGAVYSDGSSGQAAANSVCDLTDSYFVITFIDSADALCDTVVLDPCTAGTLANSDSVGVCEGETFTIETNGDHEFPAAGGYGWNFSPGADGTGGPFAGAGFSYSGAGPIGNTWDNSLNGLLTGLEMEGTWIITGFSYADTNDVSGSLCGFTPTDKIVNFLASNDPACALVEICNNGIDDDGDGQIDCLDGDCATDSNCALASDSCEAPTDLSIDNITSSSADFSWSGAGTFDVELVDITASGTATETPTATDVSNPYTFDGLASNNDYEAYVRSNCQGNDLILTGAYDGPLTGGTPKGVEIYVLNDIADLSAYGIGSANNGGGTDGQEFTFSGSATAGSFIYVTTDSTRFHEFFGFAADFVDGSMAINGDDAIELFFNGNVLDIFGDINTDGSFTAWDYLDGWAYRKDNTGPEGAIFTISNWDYSGINNLENGTTNATCTSPFPIGTFSTTGRVASEWVGPIPFTTTDIVVAGPANDSCAGAVVIACPTGFEGIFDPSGATADDAPNSCAGTVGPGVWFKFVGTGQDLNINVTPYGWDAEVQLFSGSCGSLFCEQNEDDPETITGFTTQNGTDYYIYVGTWSSSDTDIDSFYLSVSCSEPVTCDPFVGDSVENPIVIGSLPYSDIQNQGECFTDQYAQAFESPDVVYEITTGSNTDSLIIDLCNDTTDFDTYLYLSDGNITLVDNDDSPFGGICSYLAVDVEPNTTYYIIVEGLEASDLGWFEITVEERELPEPPSCAAPTALLAENVTSTTADLSWTPGGNETVWHLEITDGAFTGVPTVIGLTDTFYLATALDSLTDYSFYVIADCGTDSSEWAGPEDFTTLGTVVGPSNDDCANATPLVCNAPALTGQTTDGTVAEDDPVGCASEYGVWYSFVGDGSEVTITSANNSFDHELDIFSSDSDCNGTFTTVTCRDASVGAESYTFTTTIGTQYYVYVAHFSTSSLTTGTFDIEMTCETAVAPPANDSCGGAVVITCPTGFEGVVDPAGATAGDAPDVCAGTVGPGVWYKYVGDGQVLDINVTPYGWDAEVQLLSGSCGSFVCEQNADDPESITGFTTQVGTDYYIYVSTFASFDTDIDSFYLSVSCSDPVTCDPFVGDSVENPIVIGSLPYSDIQNQGECFTDQYAQAFESPDVVYEITTGPNTDSLIIDLCNDTTDFDTWMYLSDGIGTLEDNNNSPFGGVCSYLAVDVEPNTTYYIIVEGNFPTDLGWFEITVEEIELPEPPSCATPTALTAENVTSTTADLSWTPGGDETVWHLEITDGPFTGVPTVSGLTDTFYLATGLDSLTEYSFYVIADCGTDSSEWAGPEDFATLGTTEEPCEVWINPTPTTGWVDFNTIYGGAPCDDGGGCPFNEIDAFEVWASEAYNVENFIAGGEYTFSMCNGPGAGSWVPEFTIIAPSGAIDAFGPGDGDGCSISWTASESGTYLIVINEAGLCGTSTNTATDNGFPALTCNSGGLAACLPPPEAPINDTCSGAIAITCPSGFEGTVDASGATATDAPLCNGSSTGAGVWYTYEGDGESLNIFVDPYGFDAEIQIHSGSCGALVCETSVDNGLSVGDPESISGFETVIGTTYYIYIGSWISTETVIDSFDLSITCGAIVCDAGSLAPSSIDSFAICPDSTVTIEGLGDETIPVGGGYGIFFVPGPGGTGALGDSFIFNNTPLPLTFDSDLNGVLSGNGFPEFEGTWYVQGATYTDPGNTFNTICDLTDDYMVVTFLAAGEGPCAPPPPAPINDTCSGAIAISCDDIIYGNTDNATADASLGTCGTGLTTAPGVWYVFAGTGEAVEFSLCDDTTDFDTKIGVFEGSCGALNCVAGNDDDCGLASTVEVNTVIGTDYYVYVTGFQTNTGNFGLSVTCSVIVPAPENDTCGGATVITCPSFFVSEDASNATLSDAPTCSGSTVGPGLWYTYTGDGSTLDITATPNDWDMEIQLFSGVCGDLVCEENADVGLDGDPESITDFQTVPGTQYYLYVGTWANFVDDIDAFDLEITCTPPPACDAPTALTVENITETSADLSWTPLSGESSWNIEIVDITDGGTFTGTPTVSGLTDTFYLAIGLNPANEYEFYVQADCDFDESEWAGPEPFETLTPAPSNDTCGGAIALTCGASLEGTTIGASADDKPTSNCFSLSEGVWYTFVGNGDIVTIDVVPDANFDPELDLSSGACGVLTPVACVDDGFSAGEPESVTFFAEVGVDYFLYVSDWNSSTTNDNAGDFTISVSCVTPPANDQCDGAIEVSCDDVITGSTATASADGSLSFCGTSLSSAPGVWYYFAGTGDDVTASLCGSDFDTKIGVFDGTCDALSCIDGNDDFCGIQSEVTFSTEVGTDYFIYVTGFSSNSGDYTLSITCTVPPCDTAQVSGSITDAVCGGDGAIDITVTGGSGSYTFLWSNGETSEDITGVDAGDYSVEILDAEDGCPATATFTVGGPDALEEPIAAVVVGLPCDGSSTNTASIDVTIEGGTEPYDFLWSNAATTEDLTDLGEGTYTLTVTDANGCTYTTQDFVIEPAGTSSLVEISPAVVTHVDCYGNSTGAIDISVSGGVEPYTYRWSNNLDTEDISGLPAGEYIFFVIDATGCEYTSAVIVVEQPDPIEESTPGVVTNADCNGAATGAIDITVIGGTAPYTYVWSDGSTDEDPSGLAAGSYQATVTDANGCSFLSQVYVVGEPTGIAVGANPVITDADCNGASTGAIDITVSGGTPDYTFLWSDGSSDEDLSGVPAGTYNVIVTDANGCEFVSPAYEVGEPSAIEITAVSVTDVDCNGAATGAINISVSGGTPPYSYLWSNGDVTQDITDLVAGDYVGIITDANGCTIVSPAVTVGEPAAIEVTEAVVTDVDCNGASTGSIDITVDGGTPPYTYAWSNGATTEDLVGVPAGDYFGIITDANGCIFASPILTVNEPEALAISSVDVTNNLCNGDEEGAIDIEVTGGTEPYSYLWSNGETSQDISGLAAGSYTGVITDANGCELTATVTVGEPAAIFEALPPTVTQISCNGETDGAIDITIQGGVLPYTYLWSNGETTADISGLEAGDYSYVVTDANGCVFDPGTTITIEEPEALSESATVTDVACLGESTGSVDLTVEGGTAPYSYAWSNGATSEDISELAAGDYSVTITDANGCSLGSATYTVGEPATALTAEVTVTDESGNGVGDGTATVTASGGDGPYSYNWAGGFGISPTIDNLTSGIYCANVTDGNGCTITVCGTVGSPTAIDDIFQVSLITLYPNPTYDIANLQVSFTKAIDVELALVDVLGKVYESEYVLSTDEVAKSFDMRKYAAGTYFIRITADKEVITLPLVVQH